MSDYVERLRGSLITPAQGAPSLRAGQHSDARIGGAQTGSRSDAQVGRTTFASALQQAQNPQPTVSLSGHAMTRLRMRGIHVTPQLMQSLTTAVNQLADKGARDSLVVIGDTGFVVNVPNRTVVTAMGMNEGESQMFTSIDSAVWMRAGAGSSL